MSNTNTNKQITESPAYAEGYANAVALAKANDLADWLPVYERAAASPRRGSDPYAAGWFAGLANAKMLATMTGKIHA